MTFQNMPHQNSVSTVAAFPRALTASCPDCGHLPVAPVAAAYAGCGSVQHVWSCEECGHAFRTSVRFNSRTELSPCD